MRIDTIINMPAQVLDEETKQEVRDMCDSVTEHMLILTAAQSSALVQHRPDR